MIKRNPNILWGLLLIAGGALLLLQNFNLLGNLSAYIWAGLCLAAGIVFLGAFAVNRERWWALIPGVILPGVGTIILLSVLNEPLGDQWSGSIILGSIGLAFWLVFAARRDSWWALFPAGVLTTLAVVAGLDERISDFQTGGIFFLGLAVTFLLVFLATRMRWAVIVTLGLGVMAALAAFGMGAVTDYVIPAALILGGVFLLVQVFRPARQ